MRQKEGVNLLLSPKAARALAVAASVCKRFGFEIMVTSAKDGVHGANSLHRWQPGDERPADAFDVRLPSRCLAEESGYPWPQKRETIDRVVVDCLRDQLLRDYDVVLEKDHIHIEYDPEERR